jgi:hypothetical protein
MLETLPTTNVSGYLARKKQERRPGTLHRGGVRALAGGVPAGFDAVADLPSWLLRSGAFLAGGAGLAFLAALAGFSGFGLLVTLFFFAGLFLASPSAGLPLLHAFGLEVLWLACV